MLKQTCDMFFKSLRKKNTKRAYLGAFNEFYNFLGKTYRGKSYENLALATVRDAYNYYDFISSKRGITNRNDARDTLAASATLVLKIKALTRLYDALMDAGDVTRNIFRNNFIVLPQKDERMKRKTEIVPISTIKKLLSLRAKDLKEQQAINIAAIIYAGGLRRSEAIGLEMRDVKIDGKTLYLELRVTKSGRPQIQHLPMWAAPFVTKQVTQRSLEGASNNDKFFVAYGSKGKLRDTLCDYTLYRHVIKLLKSLGVYNRTPHSLRKSMINGLVEKEVHIEKIRTAARHNSISTTQKYFADVDVMCRKTADLVDI